MGHDHRHGGQSKNILIAFFLNFSFAIVELFGGYLTNSVAIYSDAIHDLGDSLALLFSYFAEKYSRKEADAKYTYGYKRYTFISALLNGFILVIGSVFVIKEAVLRIDSPEKVDQLGMLILSVIGIAVNSFAGWKLSKDKGLNSKMLMFHLLEDLLGWVAVMIVSVILFFKPWYVLDSVLSILISFIILKGVLSNLIKVSKILVQRFPKGIDRRKLTEDIQLLEGVSNVHLLQGWSLDEETSNVTIHVKVSPEMRMLVVDQLRLKIEDIFKAAGVTIWTIQFECSPPNDRCNT